MWRFLSLVKSTPLRQPSQRGKEHETSPLDLNAFRVSHWSMTNAHMPSILFWGSAIGRLRIRIRVGEPYSYTLTFCSATDIVTKRIRIRIQRRRPVKLAAPRPLRIPRPLSRTLRVCRLTAVVYEYTLRLSSRHFFTAVKLIRKVRR